MSHKWFVSSYFMLGQFLKYFDQHFITNQKASDWFSISKICLQCKNTNRFYDDLKGSTYVWSCRVICFFNTWNNMTKFIFLSHFFKMSKNVATIFILLPGIRNSHRFCVLFSLQEIFFLPEYFFYSSPICWWLMVIPNDRPETKTKK